MIEGVRVENDLLAEPRLHLPLFIVRGPVVDDRHDLSIGHRHRDLHHEATKLDLSLCWNVTYGESTAQRHLGVLAQRVAVTRRVDDDDLRSTQYSSVGLHLCFGLLDGIVLECVTRMLVHEAILDQTLLDQLSDARANRIDERMPSTNYEHVDVAGLGGVCCSCQRRIEDAWLGDGGRVSEDTIVGEGRVVEIDLVGEGE